MDIFQSIIIGLIQGLTEFLPISSTAHVRVIPALLGWNDPGAAVTAVTQLGTLVAVLIFFRKDLGRLLHAGFFSVVRISSRKTWYPDFDQNARMAWFIVLGTLPVGVLGIFLKHRIETDFRNLTVMACSLIGLALMLALAEKLGRQKRDLHEMGFIDTQVVGFAQAIALIPGASRSGTTITAGLFLGLTRKSAARFSFLLSVPAILASGLFELRDLLQNGLGDTHFMNLFIATSVAGIVGYTSIAFLLRWLETHSTGIFIIYRIVLGILILILAQANWIH